MTIPNHTVRQHRGVLKLVLPIRTSNPLNGSQACYHARARVRKQQRSITALTLAAHARAIGLPARVLVTRVAPRKLDAWDGLGAALKGIIDGVADAFGVRDDDPRLRIEVSQQRGEPREYGVLITIESAQPTRGAVPVAPPSGTLTAGE